MEKTKSSKYWENRKEWLIYHQMESADKTADRIGKLYHRAYLEIEKKMNNVLDRFAFKYRMSREQALDILERLNNKNDVDELIKELRLHGDNIDIKELSMMMDSPSYWYRINALKDTMAEVDTVMKLVYNNELAVSTEHYKKAANDSFLKNTYTLQQQTGYGYRVSTLPPETVSKLLKSKWSGANYSKRIWNNTTTLAGDLKTELLTSVLMGRTESETMKIFLNKFAVGANTARRLVRTESAYIYNQMDTEAYKNGGIEYYRFVATLDLKTSEVCKELDGKVFKTTDAQVGVNFPPMHPWCRSVTIANIDDDTLKTLDRRAGKEKVPANMTYKEWKDKFVVSLKDMNDTQEYRPIQRSENTTDIIRGKKRIVVRNIENSTYKGEIVISESVKVKPRQMHDTEMLLNKALKLVGEDDNLPKCVIISSEEMQNNAVCTYKAINNTLYINSGTLDVDKLVELQESMACPNNPMSTYVHELIHWKDAQEYKKYNTLDNQGEYLKSLRKKSKKRLDKLEKQGYDILNISRYASKAYNIGKYDETWTEYRVLKLLKESE